jgi:hypothetical protein
MSLRSSVFLVGAVFGVTAFAQADDDLAPLAPLPKTKPKPKPAAKPAPKPKPAAKPAPKPDEELAPIAPVAKTGELVVHVAGNVSRAALSIDGKEVGTLPLAPQTLPVGEHTVTVKRAGYAQFVKKVTVAGGKQTEVEAKLAPVSAVISVKSDVDDAQVLINGRLIGTAPVVDYEFPPGPVTISVIKEGFKEDKQKLTLVAGKDYAIEVKFKAPEVVSADRPVQATLTPEVTPVPAPPIEVKKEPTQTPLYQRWYFWAGVGAVLAAAAAGTAIAVSSANAQPTKLGEKEICGGKCDACVNFSCMTTAHHPLSSTPTRWEF